MLLDQTLRKVLVTRVGEPWQAVTHPVVWSLSQARGLKSPATSSPPPPSPNRPTTHPPPFPSQGECARGVIEDFDDEMVSCGVRVSPEQLLCNVEMDRVFVATASSSTTWLVQAVEQGCQVRLAGPPTSPPTPPPHTHHTQPNPHTQPTHTTLLHIPMILYSS